MAATTWKPADAVPLVPETRLDCPKCAGKLHGKGMGKVKGRRVAFLGCRVCDVVYATKAL